MTTKSYLAKGALIDLLKTQTGPGLPLDGVDVNYAWHGQVGERSIYGGGHRTHREEAVAERGLMARHLVTVSLYMRALARPACDPSETDLIVAGIGDAVEVVLHANPRLAGGLSWAGITGEQGDNSRTDDETISVLAYQLQFDVLDGWGS